VVKIFVHDCRRQEFRTRMLIRSVVGCFSFLPQLVAVIKRERIVHDSRNEVGLFSEI
jgi:hypothetical protein